MKFKFAEGEKVLCFHGPLIYEAKCLQSSVTKDKQVKYYIHYAGWNKNWDEWVPENRVLKFNDTNVQRQKEVMKQHSSLAAKNKRSSQKIKKTGDSSKDTGKDGDSSRASTPSKEVSVKETGITEKSAISTPIASTSSRGRSSKPQTSSEAKEKDTKDNKELQPPNKVKPDEKDEGPKKKRGRTEAASVETEEQFTTKIEVKIKIPDELKPCLVDDWDAITRQYKLIGLPAKITVQDIITRYIDSKKNSTKIQDIKNVGDGLIEYFNVMLGSQLLYKFERPQYSDILNRYSDTPMSKIYGGFHLLRLFVRLGAMLAFTALNESSLQSLIGHLNDFLKFLVKNSSEFFVMSNFVNSSPEYHRNAQ